MIQAYVSFWKNYVNFKGRACRGQYWWVVLANALIIGLEIGWLAVPGGGMDLAAFLSGALSVGIGELVVVAVLGLPLAASLERTGASRRIFSC